MALIVTRFRLCDGKLFISQKRRQRPSCRALQPLSIDINRNWPDFICRLNPSYSGFRRLAMKTNEGKKSTRHQSKTRFLFIFLSCESNAFDQGRPLRHGGCARAPATPFRAAFYFRGARKKNPLANRFRAIRMAAARLLACVPRTTRALSSHPPPEEFCFCEVEIPFFTEKN